MHSVMSYMHSPSASSHPPLPPPHHHHHHHHHHPHHPCHIYYQFIIIVITTPPPPPFYHQHRHHQRIQKFIRNGSKTIAKYSLRCLLACKGKDHCAGLSLRDAKGGYKTIINTLLHRDRHQRRYVILSFADKDSCKRYSSASFDTTRAMYTQL